MGCLAKHVISALALGSLLACAAGRPSSSRFVGDPGEVEWAASVVRSYRPRILDLLGSPPREVVVLMDGEDMGRTLALCTPQAIRVGPGGVYRDSVLVHELVHWYLQEDPRWSGLPLALEEGIAYSISDDLAIGPAGDLPAPAALERALSLSPGDLASADDYAELVQACILFVDAVGLDAVQALASAREDIPGRALSLLSDLQ